MKKLLNTILLLALLLCYNSCIDSKYIYEKETPIEEFVIVTTREVTDITSVSASISGYVEQLIIEEGTNVEIGIVYSSTDSIPDINNGITILSDSEAEGKYTVSLTGLSDNATYFYRSYVITDNNVYYGEVSSFTTKAIIVTTGAATDITSVSASISGNVENLVTKEGDNVEIGVIYSTIDTIPSIEKSNIVKSDNKADGEFTVSLTDLSDGATYFYRSYVITDNNVYYGEVSMFTTKSIIVTTGVATDITGMSATISGSVENLVTEEGANVIIGIVYSNTETIPSVENSLIVKSDNIADGEFTVSLADLNDGATYYYRTYVIADDKVYYGRVSTFTTKKIIVTTGAASDITSISATVSGSVSNLAAGITNVEIGVVYSENNNTPSIGNGTTVKSGNNSNGEFTISLNGLNDGVTYNYCTYVKIADKVYYGDVLSFTTKDEITSGQEVDLGLSVKWAGWNVGATSPEQYGGYYAWGETEEKSDYSVQTYKHYNDSIGYVNIGENISGTQYDVATAKWGNGWRMPTKGEFDELVSKCNFELYSYKRGSYCNGLKITGPNGNAIFMPFDGCYYGTSLGSQSPVCYGFYWSGSLEKNQYSWSLFFDYFVDAEGHYTRRDERTYGMSVRPVRDY